MVTYVMYNPYINQIMTDLLHLQNICLFVLVDVVISEPRPQSPVKEEVSIKGFVGLEELAKTDRILVQQVRV